ncbi:MAG: hypothetical protein DWQ47_17285 [Acidobacteria bacterium]|nr:MAG: hypothetical protein DWQ32_04685 [Acidobacteriota bacterium]REK02205.1 MAG: hypothetical protein DWQ38_07465 [Acidobacteriota bacterium]REK13992.1 MAG: hypothetical protein DWQ43_10375 [Acidobacteriota bacterium]REK41987.1 MAG: hypothetical protein DWQ47_17285 [Acidobacteriota bacterium]
MQKANQFKLKPTAKPVDPSQRKKPAPTGQIASKMTSKTLVEFKNENSQLPDWRLQLQNAVQKRLKNSDKEFDTKGVAAVTSAEPGQTEGEKNGGQESETQRTDNRYLNNALKRIESSRSRYLVQEPEPVKTEENAETPKKDFPFTIAARTENPETETTGEDTPKKSPQKPILVKQKKSVPIKDLYDTSELDPHFKPAKLSSSFDKGEATAQARTDAKVESKAADHNTTEPVAKAPGKEVRADADEEIFKPASVDKPEAFEPEIETAPALEEETRTENEELEFDDFASMGLRFNAAIFDLLIGAFLSGVLLLPFVIAGGNWFTFNGLAAFAATCTIVMFIYLTVSLGMAGRSFGMHIFSLEMIDIGGENYPTLHQSAVSSAVYLVSVACLGIGFATALFDRDRRAAHDLLSGTLVVREL